MKAVPLKSFSSSFNDSYLGQQINKFLSPKRLDKRKLGILFRALRIAHQHLDSSAYFPNLEEPDDTNYLASVQLSKTYKSFMKSLKAYEEINPECEAKSPKIKSLMDQIALPSLPIKKITPSSKRRGRKRNLDWRTIIPTIAEGYCAAFRVCPTVSKHKENEYAQSNFHQFLEGAASVISSEKQSIKQSTLHDYIQEWKNSPEGIKAIKSIR